jgi:hypothetical protein
VSHEASGSLSMMYGTDLATGLPATQAWRFQGGTWAVQPGPLPPLRYECSLGYDAAHNQTVLFGGHSPSTGLDLDETWLWNGISWTPVNPPTRPSARQGAAMACDYRRGVVVLFGGRVVNIGTDLNDTWEWNGTSWQLRALPSSPPARTYAKMAFDPVNGSVLMHSGFTSLGSQLLLFDDT